MTKKHVSGHFLGAVLAVVFSFAVMSGCSDDNGTTTLLQGDNCDNACERYAACFNPSFDVGACENRCEAALENSTISVTVTDDCVACIGVNVCSAVTYNCSAVCGAFIIVE